MPGFKFISGISLGLESTYYGDLETARPPCQKRCDDLNTCKAIRLYSFVGTVYCTLFETITAYSCPTYSTDWHCSFADGESWTKSNWKGDAICTRYVPIFKQALGDSISFPAFLSLHSWGLENRPWERGCWWFTKSFSNFNQLQNQVENSFFLLIYSKGIYPMYR